MPRKKKLNQFFVRALEGTLPNAEQMTKKDKEEYLALVKEDVYKLLAKYGVDMVVDYSVNIRLKPSEEKE